MATSSSQVSVHPLRYAIGTVAFTSIASVIVGMFTIPIYSMAEAAGEPYLRFFILSVLGFGILLSQEFMFEDGSEEEEDDILSFLKTGLIAILGIAIYNVLIFISIFVASVALALGAGQWAFLIAFLYPAYDLLTGSKGNPISIIGLIVWVSIIFYLLGWLGKTIADSLKTIELGPIRFLHHLRYRRPG